MCTGKVPRPRLQSGPSFVCSPVPSPSPPPPPILVPVGWEIDLSLQASVRDQEVSVLPTHWSPVPPCHHLPRFPMVLVGHPAIRACGLEGRTKRWSMHLIATGGSVILVVTPLLLLTFYYMGWHLGWTDSQ